MHTLSSVWTFQLPATQQHTLAKKQCNYRMRLLPDQQLLWWCCCPVRYNAQAHVNRGVVLLEAGSLEEALQAFSDAAAIQPLNVQALYNLG